MDLPSYVIDPNCGVMIVLLNTDCSFAEMSEHMIAYGHPCTVTGLDEEIEFKEPSPSGSPPAECSVEQPVETGVIPESQGRACFRIQVSAKHLMLVTRKASSVFSKQESVMYSGKGLADIAKDWRCTLDSPSGYLWTTGTATADT
jgi:hypothetical protein